MVCFVLAGEWTGNGHGNGMDGQEHFGKDSTREYAPFAVERDGGVGNFG
jgi:hypothetical protein